MFGCPADQINSFSETFTLIPDSEEDDENCVTSGRILTAEEFIERFKNRDDIFSINEDFKLNPSEIITLLCAILACSTCNKENIKEISWFSALRDFSNIDISDADTKFYPVVECRDERIWNLILQSQSVSCRNDSIQKTDTEAVSIVEFLENGLTKPCDPSIEYNIRNSLLSSRSSPRGPPLQISAMNETVKTSESMSSLKCKNVLDLKESDDVFSSNKVDTGPSTLIGSDESNHTIDLLHYCRNISSLLLQADRRHPV